MKKLVFIFAAMTVLAFAACTETKAPEAPVEDAEAVEDAAEVAPESAPESVAETVEEVSEDAPADAAKDAENEGVRDDISVKK